MIFGWLIFVFYLSYSAGFSIEIKVFIMFLQEIAWQRLDELLPASDDVISRGSTGLKLYMVAPFLS